MLGGLPWFAWIAIVAILVWGTLQVVQLVTGRALPGEEMKKEVEELRTRLDAIEGRRPAGELPARADAEASDLERRLERLEARADRREARDREHDDWDRRAGELG